LVDAGDVDFGMEDNATTVRTSLPFLVFLIIAATAILYLARSPSAPSHPPLKVLKFDPKSCSTKGTFRSHHSTQKAEPAIPELLGCQTNRDE
jgi:hypothetical protein